jgi:aryl-alcohol dehydrogenase-like predicted oxidoreductase
MSANYGSAADTQEMIALLPSAAERGVTFFNTAKAYGLFTNRHYCRGNTILKRTRRMTHVSDSVSYIK